MLLPEGEKEPAMLEHVQDRAEIPERRHNEGDFFRNALEFLIERRRVLDVFDRVRAEGIFELAGRKGKVVDVIDDDEVRHFGVFDDIDIDAASIGLPAADIEVPDIAPSPDDPAHDAVAEPVESGENENEGGGE